MSRVKRGVTANKRRKNLLKYAKGFKWSGKSKYITAKHRLLHGWSRAFGDRRKKKGNFRALWQVRINAAVRENDLSYSKFIFMLKEANVELDRKVLSNLAKDDPEVFKKIVEEVK